jgi:hypothetical protein
MPQLLPSSVRSKQITVALGTHAVAAVDEEELAATEAGAEEAATLAATEAGTDAATDAATLAATEAGIDAATEAATEAGATLAATDAAALLLECLELLPPQLLNAAVTAKARVRFFNILILSYG